MIMPIVLTKTTAPALLLDRSTVAQLLTLDECLRAVESAFGAHESGKCLRPQLLHVDADGGEFHIKVGGLAGTHSYFACKVNGGFFQNRARLGLPNIVGLILLCDGSTGAPLAVMESGLVTRLRTGAATAIAAKYLARSDSQTVTICGAGSQGESQLRALAHVLPLRRAFIWSRNGAEDLAALMSRELSMDVRPVLELGGATRSSDIIVTCTPSRHWFIGQEHVSPGTFIAAVGADSPDKQEIEPELLAASVVVPDLLQQAVHAGDLHHAIEKGLMRAEDVRGELGAVIIHDALHRTNNHETIVFDSTGTALQDVAVAAAVYERAVSLGHGTPFAFWD